MGQLSVVTNLIADAAATHDHVVCAGKPSTELMDRTTQQWFGRGLDAVPLQTGIESLRQQATAKTPLPSHLQKSKHCWNSGSHHGVVLAITSVRWLESLGLRFCG